MLTWFITGISRGLGKALAEAALARGDTVIGTVRSGRPEIETGPGQLHVLTLDVTDSAATERAAREAEALAPGIDVLVNNAGYGLLGAFEDATEEEIAHLFAVNVFPPLRLIRAFLPRMREAGRGHILNITSIAGRAPGAGSAAYAATKGALEALSHSLAQEVGPFGIRVTAIAPGAFRTDFLDDHSIRRSGTGPDSPYAGTVEAMRRFEAMAGQQLGDPARAAAAILALVDAEAPPVHLLLGSDALRRKRAALDLEIAEIDAWAETARRTDFPEGA